MGSELRIPNAAAQTRIVSGGQFWPSRREVLAATYAAACGASAIVDDGPGKSAKSASPVPTIASA